MAFKPGDDGLPGAMSAFLSGGISADWRCQDAGSGYPGLQAGCGSLNVVNGFLISLIIS